MKKDFDLIRKILKVIEDNDEEYYHISYNRPLEINGHSEKEIVYNLQLMFDEGLIEGDRVIQRLEVVEVLAKPTNKGHDFIRLAKNNNIWSSFKNKIGCKLMDLSADKIINELTDFVANWNQQS